MRPPGRGRYLIQAAWSWQEQKRSLEPLSRFDLHELLEAGAELSTVGWCGHLPPDEDR